MVTASHFCGLVIGTGYFSGAGLAVDFFFMLSGFIMARTYDHRMPSAPQFLWLRAKRLWPAFAFGVILGAAFGLAPLYFLPVALLFLPIPALGLFAFNPPAWSLFCELIANVVHSSFLRTDKGVIGLLCLLLPLWGVLSIDGFGAGETLQQLPEAFLRVAIAYSIGILIFRARWRPAVPPILAPTILLSCLIAPTFMTPLLVAVGFPLCIYGGLRWVPPKGGTWAGAISYPLYAVHFPLMMLSLHWAMILALVALATLLATWIDGLRVVRETARGTGSQSVNRL